MSNKSVMWDVVDEIKSRCNIVDVIGQVVSFKKTGGNYKGLCPFHNEKTPSFVVSETKQIFSCFGCGASGDVLEFMQKYYNLDFRESVERLAGQYGIEIKDSYSKSADKNVLYEINRQAAKFFYKSFTEEGNPAFAYMRNRGIEPDILRKFGIGYADSEWDSLYRHFSETGTDLNMLAVLGLVSESKGKYFDKFRNRVMFPIINSAGKIVGFGGRALDDSTPKYLNSPESAVFLKKNNLFGINLTRQEISKGNRAILVEGYMDVISLYQHGVRNVAATLGTALTDNHAKLIKRYTPNVCLSYDSDEAGRAAALRGIDILYKEGLKPKVIEISSGKDPDDFIRENGRQEFMKITENALPYAGYRLNTIKKKHDISLAEGKIDFIKEAVAFLKTLTPVEAEMYIKIIAKDTKISENAINLEYTGSSKMKTYKTREQVNTTAGKSQNTLERYLIRLIIASKDYFDRIRPYERAFESRQGYEIYKSVESGYNSSVELDIKSLAESLDEDCARYLQDIQENVFLAGKEEQILIDCVRNIEYGDLLAKESELIFKLSLADEESNAVQADKLTKELMEVQLEIQKKKN